METLMRLFWGNTEPAEIEYTSENWLKINHVNGPKPAVVTLQQWKLNEKQIEPHNLCVLHLYQVDVSEITEEFILLVPQCTSLTMIAFYSVSANADNGTRLMKELNKGLNILPKLARIDIRETNFLNGDFLEKLMCPKLKHLTLANMKIERQLNELLHCIKAHPKLSYLNLEECGLKSGEMNSLLSAINTCLKKLVGLKLDCNDLSSCRESLCKLVESISTIKVLSLSSCSLNPEDLLLILSNIQQDIEYISVYDNAPIGPDIRDVVFKLPSLKGFPVRAGQLGFTLSRWNRKSKRITTFTQRPDVWEFEMLGFKESLG